MHLTYGPFTSSTAAAIVLGAAADKNNTPGDVGVCWMESGNIQLLRPPRAKADGAKSVMIFRYDGLVPRNPARPNAPDYFPRFSAYARRSAAWQQDQARDWRYEVKDYDAVMAWKQKHPVVWNVGMAAVDIAAMWIGAGELIEGYETYRKSGAVIGLVKSMIGFGGPMMQLIADGGTAIAYSISEPAGQFWDDTIIVDMSDSFLAVILGILSMKELASLPGKAAGIAKEIEGFENGAMLNYGQLVPLYFDMKSGSPIQASKTWWNVDEQLKGLRNEMHRLSCSLLWLRRWLPSFDYFGLGLDVANAQNILGSFSSLGHLFSLQSGGQSGSQVTTASGFHQILISTLTIK